MASHERTAEQFQAPLWITDNLTLKDLRLEAVKGNQLLEKLIGWLYKPTEAGYKVNALAPDRPAHLEAEINPAISLMDVPEYLHGLRGLSSAEMGAFQLPENTRIIRAFAFLPVAAPHFYTTEFHPELQATKSDGNGYHVSSVSQGEMRYRLPILRPGESRSLQWVQDTSTNEYNFQLDAMPEIQAGELEAKNSHNTIGHQAFIVLPHQAKPKQPAPIHSLMDDQSSKQSSFMMGVSKFSAASINTGSLSGGSKLVNDRLLPPPDGEAPTIFHLTTFAYNDGELDRLNAEVEAAERDNPIY